MRRALSQPVPCPRVAPGTSPACAECAAEPDAEPVGFVIRPDFDTC
jgi:hypothetical protein